MREIQAGMRVQITGGSGIVLEKRAVSGVIDGSDFPVVWACGESEWKAAEAERRDPDAVPWPAEDVRPA
jgi:hypothetical protein